MTQVSQAPVIKIWVDGITQQFLKAISSKYKTEGFGSLAQPSAIIEKAISEFAHDVLGREAWEKIIGDYYDDPLGLWSDMHTETEDKEKPHH